MPDPEYTFTAQGPPVTYLRYRDLSDGSMLTGTLGHTCAIAALEEGLTVPPDGRWAQAGTGEAGGATAAAEQARLAAEQASAKGKSRPGKGGTAAPAGEGTGAGEA